MILPIPRRGLLAGLGMAALGLPLAGFMFLEYGARAYVNRQRGARIEDGRLIVSKIYAGFADDFGGSDEAVIAHLRTFANPPLAKALERRTTIDDYEYDWGLNGSGS